MWAIVKVFIEFVTISLLMYVGLRACGILAECAGVGGELGKHLAVSLKTDNTPALSHSSLKMKPCS